MYSPPRIVRHLSQHINSDATMESATYSNSAASIFDVSLHVSSSESFSLGCDHRVSSTSSQRGDDFIPFVANESIILEYSNSSPDISCSPLSLPSMNDDGASDGRPNVAAKQRKAKRLIKELANQFLFDEPTNSNHSVNGGQSPASSHDTSLFWESRVIEYSTATTTLIHNDLKIGSGSYTWESDNKLEEEGGPQQYSQTFLCFTPSEDNDDDNNNITTSPDEFAQITNKCVLHNTIRSFEYLTERDDELTTKRNPIDRIMFGIFELMVHIADIGGELCGGLGCCGGCSWCDGNEIENERDRKKKRN